MPVTHSYLNSKVPQRPLQQPRRHVGSPEAVIPLMSRIQPPPTCYGKVEILEVPDLPGALTGCETLIKGLEEVRKGQLHVCDGCPPVLTVVRPHGTDEQALESKEKPVKLPDRKRAGPVLWKESDHH